MFRIQHMKSLQTQEIFLYQTLNYSRKWSGWDKVTQRKSLNTNLTSITHNYFNYMSEFQTYLWLLLKRIGSMGVASVDVFHNSKQRDKTCWRAMSVCTAGAFPHTRQWILKCDVKKKKNSENPKEKKHLLGKKRHKHLDGLLISSIWFNKKKKNLCEASRSLLIFDQFHVFLQHRKFQSPTRNDSPWLGDNPSTPQQILLRLLCSAQHESRLRNQLVRLDFDSYFPPVNRTGCSLSFSITW